jgi:hypothetical protein
MSVANAANAIRIPSITVAHTRIEPFSAVGSRFVFITVVSDPPPGCF